MLVRRIKSDIFIFRLPKFRQFFKSYLDHRIGRGLFTVATSMFFECKKICASGTGNRFLERGS